MLVASVLVAVDGGSRVAAADPVPVAGPDPGRIGYVGRGDHRSLQLVRLPATRPEGGCGVDGGTCDGGSAFAADAADGTFTPLLAQGSAADDCQAAARGSDTVWVSDRPGDGEGIYRRTGDGPVTPVLLRHGWRMTDPKLSPDRKWIAFASFEVGEDEDGFASRMRCDDVDNGSAGADIDGDSSLWVVRTDGSGLRQVAGHGGAPDWSPDGTQLVYTNDAVAYRTSVAGGTPPVQVSPDDERAFRPAWEPAGGKNRIAYVTADSDFEHQLVLVPAAGGGEPTVIAKGNWSGSRRGVAWSPDGSRILFLSAEPYLVDPAHPCATCLGTPLLDEGADVGESVETVSWYQLADGPLSALVSRVDPEQNDIESVRSRTPVDRLELRAALSAEGEFDFSDPVYAPDGRSMAFVTYYASGVEPYRSHLMIGRSEALADAVPLAYPGLDPGERFGGAAWSPDGTKLAVTHWTYNAAVADPDAAISVVDVSAGPAAARLLSTVPYPAPPGGYTCSTDDRDPTWSPDGSTLAFSRFRHCSSVVRVASVQAPSPAAPAAPTSRDAAPRPAAGSATPQPTVTPLAAPDSFNRHIWTVPVAAPDRQTDISQVQCGGPTAPCSVLDQRPAYDPAGSGIAFVRRSDPSTRTNPEPDSMVLLVRADGGACRSILPAGTACPVAVPAPPQDTLGAHPDDPAWSPDGGRLAVDVVIVGWDSQRASRIAVVDPATGTGEILPSRLDRSEAEPTWQVGADLAVTLTGPAAPVVTGTTARLTLHVANGGPAGTRAARGDLVLPAGLAAVGDPVPSRGTCTAALHCELGALPVGAAADIVLTVRATGPGAYTVTGRADSDLIDNQPQDNTATAVVTAVAPADPAVTVTVTPPSVLTGRPATVVYTVTNLGSATAQGVTLIPTLPAGLTAVQAAPPCPEEVCALGDVAPGAVVTVTRTVSSPHALSGNAVGTVGSASPDADPANNTATAPLTVRDRPPVSAPPATDRVRADPAVALSLSPGTAYTGGSATTARVTVGNPGRARATGLTLAVVLPPGVTAASPSGCATAAGCPVGDLSAGATTTVTLVLTTPDALTGTVTANLTTTGTDASTANDTATVRLTVRAPEVRLNPVVGPPGAVTFAQGRNFPPGAVLRLRWSRGVTVASGPVRVSADGTFGAPVPVLVQDALGPRDLEVTDTAAAVRFGPVRTGYLVVPGVLQPSDFKWRR